MAILFDDHLALFDDPYVTFDGELLEGEPGDVAVTDESDDTVTVSHTRIGSVEVSHD